MAALQRLREEKERFTVETLSLSYQSSGIRGREDDADWADDVEPRGNRRCMQEQHYACMLHAGTRP